MNQPFVPLYRLIASKAAPNSFSVFMKTLLQVRDDIELLKFTDQKLTNPQIELLSDIDDIRVEVYKHALTPEYGYLLMSGKLDRFIANVYRPYIIKTQGSQFVDDNVVLCPIGEA